MIRAERELNSFDLQNNHALATFKKRESAKDTLNLPTLNRIIDRVHDDYKMIDRVRTPSFDHMRDLSSSSSKLINNNNEMNGKMGPGYYDALRFDQYIQEKSSKGVPQFKLSKSKRLEVFNSNSAGNSSSSVEGSEGPATATMGEYTRRPYTESRRPESKNGFGSEPRYKGGIYSHESYVASSTMGLGPDWDKIFITKSYGSFSKALVKKERQNEHRFEGLQCDTLHKASLATSVENSRRKYASVFRSKTPSGLQIRPPTSGDIGPGYDMPPAIIIKDPYNYSSAFLSTRNSPHYKSVPENTKELKRFSDVNSKGIKISKTGAYAGQTHKVEWTKNKIDKIYPKLGKQLFSDWKT